MAARSFCLLLAVTLVASACAVPREQAASHDQKTAPFPSTQGSVGGPVLGGMGRLI